MNMQNVPAFFAGRFCYQKTRRVAINTEDQKLRTHLNVEGVTLDTDIISALRSFGHLGNMIFVKIRTSPFNITLSGF